MITIFLAFFSNFHPSNLLIGVLRKICSLCKLLMFLESSSTEEVCTPRLSRLLRIECAFSTSIVLNALAAYPAGIIKNTV